MPLLAEETIKPVALRAPFACDIDHSPSPSPAKSSSQWPEWLTLSFYAALLALAIPYHEPWGDEAQAWQLARTLSLPQLFKTYIRYEGAPGLWHFLLWILIRAHCSFTALHWLCGLVAVAATALLLFASPLPRVLKLTLPFTYFLLFQYAVIARNYVLVPILLYAVAWFWKKNPLIVALLLGLLANTSLHVAVISGGLAVVYLIEHLRSRSFHDSAPRRKLFVSALILAAFYAFAIWTAFPPHDLALSRVRGQSHTFFDHFMVSLVWAICEPWFLSIPFWIAIGAWFASRRKLLYLVPVLFFALFSGEVFANWWHAGLLVPLLVALLWITWPKSPATTSAYDKAGLAAMLLMIATQWAWSGYTLVYDHNHPYSPDQAAAAYLKPFVDNHDRIAITYIDNQGNHAFDGVGLLPYFDHNIFVNQALPFWWWSELDTTEDKFNAVLPTHPELVLVEVRYKDPVDRIDLNQPRYNSVRAEGYRFSRAYCGTFPERLQPMLTMCHVIFQYANGQPLPADAQALVPVSH